MLIFKILAFPPKVIFTSFLLWIVLTTVLPQMNSCGVRQVGEAYPHHSITLPPNPIQNSTVYFVIGHPDDEVMFFSPSLIELAKPKHNNDVRLVCFSNGDAVHKAIGAVRTQELYNSARILGIPADKVSVLDFKDGMNETWEAADIVDRLRGIVGTRLHNVVLVTFDEGGVSNHPNHISLYHGTRSFHEKYGKGAFYVLKTLNFWEKYSFTVLTNVELFVDHLSKLILRKLKVHVNVSFFSNRNKTSVSYYSDLNMLSVSYAAMSYGHFSQMVWFRYGWLLCSRYLTYNHLVDMTDT